MFSFESPPIFSVDLIKFIGELTCFVVLAVLDLFVPLPEPNPIGGGSNSNH